MERFNETIIKDISFESQSQLAKSNEFLSLSNLIKKTNKSLEQNFKREHKYDLKIYEEMLYKEVLYDARPNQGNAEETRHNNKLKKARASGFLRNFT